MRVHRCYVPVLGREAAEVALDEVEAHHVRDVLRASAGDPVVAFDGAGLARAGHLARVDRHGVVIAMTAEVPDVAPEPPCRVRVVQVLLKGDAMDDVVRDVTMLGASALRAVTSRHAVVPARAVGERSLERWRRVAVAAVKQCGRAVVPAIEAPGEVSEEWARRDDADAVRLVLVEPRLGVGDVDVAGGVALREIASAVRGRTLTLAVGPEGGWSEDEVAEARRAGWRAWSLGSRVLRAERAAFAALAVLLYAIEGGVGPPASGVRVTD